jgi:hypothetical protein
MKTLLHQISLFLSSHLDHLGASDTNQAEHEDSKTITLLNHLAGSRFGKELIAQPSCVIILLRIIDQESTTPSLLRMSVRLLSLGLPSLDSNRGQALMAMIQASDDTLTAESYVLKLILQRLISLISSSHKDSSKALETPKRMSRLSLIEMASSTAEAAPSPKTPIALAGLPGLCTSLCKCLCLMFTFRSISCW